jgi:hypothetical protein
MTLQKLWVQHQTTVKPLIDLVSTDGCDDIADLLNEIKKEFQFAIPKDSAITLYQLKDGQRLKSMSEILLLIT